MEVVDNIKIALMAIRANKIRTLLTMLGIIIGVAAVILLVAIGSGLRNYIVDQFESLGADNLIVMPGQMALGGDGEESGGVPGAGVALPKFTFAHLKKIQRRGKTVKAVMAYIESNGTMKYKGKTHITQVAGVGPEFQEVRNHKVAEGKFFNLSQYNASKKVAVIGPSVAEELFKSENPIGKKMSISDQQYTVIGILEEKGAFIGVDMDNQVFIPATTAMKQFDLEFIQSFIVQSINTDSVDQTKKEVEKILLTDFDEDEFSVMDTKNVLNIISQVLGAMTAALGGIAAISLVVGGIGIMNIMLVSVTERTREIGLRKAVGAKSKDILFQFLVEAIFLSLIGGSIGIAVGSAGSFMVGKFLQTSITFWSVAVAFSVSALIGIIFGVAPAA
ncbi:ABC transporter permease, partial [Patescibacteria group bacterium]